MCKYCLPIMLEWSRSQNLALYSRYNTLSQEFVPLPIGCLPLFYIFPDNSKFHSIYKCNKSKTKREKNDICNGRQPIGKGTNSCEDWVVQNTCNKRVRDCTITLEFL